MRKTSLTIAICAITACMLLSATGCGNKSARTDSPPPESTPGWNSYESDEATATELDTAGSKGANSGTDAAGRAYGGNVSGTVTGADNNGDSDGERGYALNGGTAADRTAAASHDGFVSYKERDFPGLKPGWYQNDKGWYRFDEGLRMLSGWQHIDGDWYYFDDTGLMAADTEHDGWYLDKDGRRQDERADADSFEELTDAEKESITASIAAEQESQRAEAELKAREEEERQAEQALRSSMAAVQAVTDEYKSASSVSETPESGIASAAWIDGALSGSRLQQSVRETEDYYIVSNASINAAQVLSTDTVDNLNAKDALQLNIDGNDYQLIVMSTGTDEAGHKTVQFKDDLITLKYSPEGYIVDDGTSPEETVYTGELCIAKDAEIGANHGGIYTKKTASEYIGEALASGSLNISGSYETDGSGVITSIAVE